MKYRSADRKAKIIVETEKSGDFILLKVQDNGLGIKEEDIKKVFLMYQRLHDHVDGTGVGMAILKRILDNTAGKIELDSQLGEGSTVKIYLVNS